MGKRRMSRIVNVAMVGDSNIVRGAGPYVDILQGGPGAPQNIDDGYVIQFYGRSGMNLNVAYWTNRLAGISADAVLLNIGVNDATPTFDPTAYGSKIDQFLALFAGLPVFWPGYPISIEPPDRQDAIHAVNHAWAIATSRHQNLTIIPWGALANSHPEWMLSGDVHYTSDGYYALAGLYHDTLEAAQP